MLVLVLHPHRHDSDTQGPRELLFVLLTLFCHFLESCTMYAHCLPAPILLCSHSLLLRPSSALHAYTKPCIWNAKKKAILSCLWIYLCPYWCLEKGPDIFQKHAGFGLRKLLYCSVWFARYYLILLYVLFKNWKWKPHHRRNISWLWLILLMNYLPEGDRNPCCHVEEPTHCFIKCPL